jgi:hypothetical protein
MNQPEPVTGGHKKNKNRVNPVARRIGYLVSIVVMIVVIYILRHLREWGLNFLTDDWDKCLFYINVSIYISIGANFLFIIYDSRWFKHFLQALVSIASAVALIMLWVIFPFNFMNDGWDQWVKIILLVLFGFTIIGIIADFVKGVRYLVRDTKSN